MTCIFFIIGDNDVVGEGLFDSEAKELKQVVLIWPISPKIFTEIKVMWMWKKELLLFSTIFLFRQPGFFDQWQPHCMQIHASTDSMDDKRDSRQGLVVRRVTLSTAMSTENQLAGPHHRGNSSPPSKVPSYGFQNWDACQGLCVHGVDLSTTISLLNLLTHREPISRGWPQRKFHSIP